VAGGAETGDAPDTVGGDTTAGRTLEELTGVGDTASADTTGVAGLVTGNRPLSSLLQTIPRANDQNDFLVPETEVPNVESMLADSAAVSALAPGYEWLWSGDPQTFSDGRSYETLYLLHSDPLMTGEAVATASAGFDPQLTSQPIVSLEMTSEGAGLFGDITRAHVNQRLAIVLDEVVRMAPNINQPIADGHAQIEGFDSVEEARDIAIVLRAGALPAPLEIIEERTVGPSLGADSVEAGRMAGLLGLLAVMALMAVYYRASGLVANVALLLNIVLVLAALAGFGATLTLPGIAGLILTVGMAVDANVLIFERVREELEVGKTVRAAIDAGYDRAFVTILDAQLTTLIAAAVLFQFGTGPIKGFAVVLTIGIICSIFTAVFVTRTIFDTWMRRSAATRLSI
jgi:preprotein translocase subunit SecD